MTAIIKNNFRLQNARDFLENFVGHPRVSAAGSPNPIETRTALTTSVSSGIGTANYSWTWDLSDGVDATEETEVKIDAAKSLKTELGAHVTDRNHYLFVGKSTPWSTLQEELFPNPALDTLDDERKIWNEMLGLKKINDAAASLVIPRVNWDTSGKTIYAIFDDKNPNSPTPSADAIDSAEQTGIVGVRAGGFYVLTDEYDVFICIENNNGKTPSTIKPQRDPSNVTDRIRLTDGYTWKYITSIRSADAVKFLTDSWIPVKTLVADDDTSQWDVQQAAVPGEVLSVVVDNAGESYINTHAGKLLNATTVGGKGTAQLVARVGGASPSGTTGTYNGASIHVDDSIYTIESYVVSGDGLTRTITITSGWANNTAPADDTESEILPRLIVSSDGSEVPQIKPIVDATGKISGANVLIPGEGAASVIIEVVDCLGGSGAKLRAVVAPRSGLGADPEKDLGAFFVMLNARLEYNEGNGDFPVSNDYRQIGIIRNVIDRSTQKLAVAPTLSAVKSLLVSIQSGSDFQVDSTISQVTDNGTAQAIVVESVHPEGAAEEVRRLSLIQTPETGFLAFQVDNVNLVESGSGLTLVRASVTSIAQEEVQKFVGEILYVENRRPILRAEDQLEDIKAIIEF